MTTWYVFDGNLITRSTCRVPLAWDLVAHFKTAPVYYPFQNKYHFDHRELFLEYGGKMDPELVDMKLLVPLKWPLKDCRGEGYYTTSFPRWTPQMEFDASAYRMARTKQKMMQVEGVDKKRLREELC